MTGFFGRINERETHMKGKYCSLFEEKIGRPKKGTHHNSQLLIKFKSILLFKRNISCLKENKKIDEYITMTVPFSWVPFKWVEVRCKTHRQYFQSTDNHQIAWETDHCGLQTTAFHQYDHLRSKSFLRTAINYRFYKLRFPIEPSLAEDHISKYKIHVQDLNK